MKNKKTQPDIVATRKESGEKNLSRGGIVAALDIGSSKICCFIAEIGNHGGIEVIGIGHQASRGVKSGAIVDLKAAEMACSHAIEAAEIMAKDRLMGQPSVPCSWGCPARK